MPHSSHTWPNNYLVDAAHFENRDASGFSQRVTRSYPEHIFGVPSWDRSYIDQRHAEFDAAGGNVGTVTSYQPQYGTVNTDFLPIEAESELFIDGMRQPCELDGMTVSCMQLARQAESGGVGVHEVFLTRDALGRWILDQRTWNLEPVGMGIFAIDRAFRGNKEPGRGFHWTDWTMTFQPQRQTDDKKKKKKKDKIDPGLPPNIRQLVSDLAQRPDCADILEKFAEELRKKGKLDETEPGKTFIESVFDNLTRIEINNRNAGSGATTDGRRISVRDYSHLPIAHQNALYAKYIIQELVHDFKKGNGMFRDSRLGIAAESILSNMEQAKADKIRDGFKATGYKAKYMLGHYLINQFCQYTQTEVDNGQPQ